MLLEINMWNVNSNMLSLCTDRESFLSFFPCALTWWGWICLRISVCMERPCCDPSTLKQSLIRLDTTEEGEGAMEGFVFTSLTKLDQRLDWESKKWRLSKQVCSNGAFDHSSLFLHAQGTKFYPESLRGSEYTVYLSWRFESSLNSSSVLTRLQY